MSNDKIDSLTPEERRALLARLLEARARPQELPLTAGQHALWFLAELDPTNAAYHGPFALRLRSPVDVEALRRACQRLVDRHPALRTQIVARDGAPRQLVAPAATVDFAQVDASALSDAALSARLDEESRRPFDLSAGPLFRVQLWTRAPSDHVLLVVAHHVVADLWSLLVVVDELRRAYAAEATGRPLVLPPLAADFGAHVRREEAFLASPAAERAYAYWLRELAGELPVLTLPTDHPRAPVQTFRGGSLDVHLDRATTARMRELAAGAGATLNSALLAAFTVWLGRLAGQDDVLVGVPTIERDHAQLAGVVGYFVNPVVIRSDLTPDPTFRGLLRAVHTKALDALAHNALPFPRLVQRLEHGGGRAGHSPVFQAMFVLQQAQRGDAMAPLMFGGEGSADFGGLRAEAYSLASPGAQFDVEMMLVEVDGEVRGRLFYNRDLFEPDTIARLLGHFGTLVAGASSAPDTAVSRLPLLTAEERARAVVEWNRTHTDHPRDVCFHQLFAARARSTPQAPAVSFLGTTLDYRELDARAERLAERLRGLGVGRDQLAAILMDRSIDMLVAILAVFKAGGAYVPLDPGYPADRLHHILTDAAARVLIAERRWQDRIPAAQPTTVLWIDEASSAAAPIDAPAGAPAAPHDLSYVIYTSGSTGRPKGAMIEHVGMLNHLHAKVVDLGLVASDVILQNASQCFDISVWQFLCALLVGGRTHVVPDEVAHDPSALLAELEARAVTIAEVVPSMLRAMLESIEARRAPPPSLARLRWLLVTGEPLPPDLCRTWYRNYPRVPLLNAYGPTECSDDVTHHALFVPPPPEATTTPVGRPIINTEVYVLDRHLEPVPVGVYGEVYVGGVGVGRGYLGQPERTASVFVPDVITARPGARLYRTGDRARYLPDGVIDVAGRLDHQVKVRGFRIELGEIEAALLDQAGVKNAVVLAREGVAGAKRLVGYVELDAAAAPSVAELRAALHARLPDYMVPDVIVRLEAMPLTPNGKLDRRALPEPSELETAPVVAPSTDTERALVQIWGEVLGREGLGVRDNFFEIGGHSLLATQVRSRVRSTLGIDVPLHVYFEHPTIAELGRRLDEASGVESSGRLESIPRASRDQALPLSFAQERQWFLDQLEPGSAFYNVPAALELRGPLSVEALARSFAELVRRHELLRTSFPAVEGRPRPVTAAEVEVPLPVEDLRGLSAAALDVEVQRRSAEEASRPFSLSTAPLLRTRLLRTGEEAWVLVMTMHSMVADGWTAGVVFRELAALYPAFAAGQPSPLPELPIQYADFAVWQRGYLDGELLDRQLTYWERRLADAPPHLDLPSDRPRPAQQSYRGRGVPVRVARAQVEALTALAHQHGATPFMALLALFQAVIARWTGRDDVVVGSPIANRTHPDTEGLVGLFLNSLVMRTDLGGQPSFRALLERVREVTLGAYAHQEVPFERLVESLVPERDLSRSPLFQSMIVLQNAPLAAMSLGEVAVRGRLLDTDTAKLDLLLMLWEADGALEGRIEFASDLFDDASIARFARHYGALLDAVISAPDAPVSAHVYVTTEDAAWLAAHTAPAAESPVARALEAKLAALPAVAEVAVVGPEDRPVAYVVLADGGPDARAAFAARERERWRAQVGAEDAEDAAPAELDRRARRVLRDGPRAVLELGCGVGRLLGRVAPEVKAYWAIEGSAAAAERARREQAGEARVEVRPIDDLSGIPEGHFDTVIIGSRVVTSAPDEQAVAALIDAALPKLAPRGRLVLEGVVPLPLLEGAWARRELVGAPPARSRAEIAVGLSRARAAERRLALGPAFFAAWSGRARVDVELVLDGEAGDEPAYRVVICPDGERGRTLSRIALDGRPLGMPELEAMLASGEGLELGGLRNARLAEAGALAAALAAPDAAPTAAGLWRHARRALASGAGLDPEALLALGERRGLVVVLGVGSGRADGALDAAFAPRDAPRPELGVAREGPRANAPLAARARAELRAELEARVGAEMGVPVAWVVVESLPRDAAGAVDRHALPRYAPGARGAAAGGFSTALEERVAAVWREVLGPVPLGADDGFFDVGGTSLSLVRVKSGLEGLQGREIPIVDLFRHHTIRALAAYLEDGGGAAGPSAEDARRRADQRQALLERQRQRRKR